jgi:hypothetical protein
MLAVVDSGVSAVAGPPTSSLISRDTAFFEILRDRVSSKEEEEDLRVMTSSVELVNAR